MPQPTTRDVHIDAALSNISIAYKNERYLADQVFPPVEVPKQSDYFFTWTRDFWFRNHVQRREAGGVFQEAGLVLSQTQFNCLQKALAFPLADEVIDNQDAAIDLEKAGAEFLADQFALDREIALKGKIMDASAWGSNTTLSGTNQWSDYENSNPLGNVDTGVETVKKATGHNPNVALMNAEVYHRLRRHPDLLDLYKYTTTALLNEAQIAAAINVKKILVGDAIQNTANEGAAYTGAYIWDKNCILMYVAERPGLMVPSAGYTFVWKQNGYTIPIQRIRDDQRGRDVLQGKHSFDQKVTSSACGYEIIDAVA